ncbi:DUF1109 domain-containing protein [Nocardia sp. NPDC057440]|uniref:DUF1109 domain-containing protein n=1 Tax=Nocardia sp. NPDC057440 TaxID=3346134 RepID=UPI0036712390
MRASPSADPALGHDRRDEEAPIETSRVHGAQTELGQDAATAPGFAVLTSAALGVAVLLCVHVGWAPFIGDSTGADQFAGLVIGGIVLSTSLLVWAIKTLYLVGREHRWSWKVAAAPAIVLAGVVAGMVFRPDGFDAARPAMEDVAVEMLRADGPTSRRDLSLGGLDISFAQREPDGRVYFYDADGSMGSTVRGWVYSPGTEPVRSNARLFEKLSGDWYTFVFSTE